MERPTSARRGRHVAYVIAFLALAGLTRNSMRSVPWPDAIERSRVGEEYEALRAALPADAGTRVGFVHDAKLADAWEPEGRARYAFAPRVVVPLDGKAAAPRYVVGRLSAPDALDEVCRAFHLRLVARYGAGDVVLLEAAP
jgi:hypothetical protein